MRIYQLTNMLVHEYSEYEWQDTYSDDIVRDEYVKQSVERAKELGLRYFNVLVKPADELLSDAKPETAIVVDVWRQEARSEAENLEFRYPNMDYYAILALFAQTTGATIEYDYADAPTNTIYIPIVGMGYAKFEVPKGLCKQLFDLPENKRVHKQRFFDTKDILETVLLRSRMNGTGAGSENTRSHDSNVPAAQVGMHQS